MKLGELIYLILCIMTAMIDYHLYHSIFLAILAFFFAPIVWIYWLITQQINISIIKDTFTFFLK